MTFKDNLFCLNVIGDSDLRMAAKYVKVRIEQVRVTFELLDGQENDHDAALLGKCDTGYEYKRGTSKRRPAKSFTTRYLQFSVGNSRGGI